MATYRFDDLVVDSVQFKLVKAGRARTLTPKAFDLFLYLIEHRGRVVGRQELFDKLWKDAFVTDNALTRVIKEIRQTIGDDADTPRYVETIPKRGYRFIGLVAEPPLHVDAPSATAVKTLAVLPFATSAEGAELEYLSEGIASGVISGLSQLSSLRVLARSTVFRYQGSHATPQTIGRELHATAVLTGRLTHLDGRVIVSVELADASDGTHIWGHEYSRRLDDVFDVQGAISREISEHLRVELSMDEAANLTRRHTQDPEAYRLYLQGYYWLYKFTPEGLNKAFESFGQAIARDGKYAPAYAGLVEAYFNLSFFAEPREVWTKAKEAAQKAVEIDPMLAEAHYGMALVKICYDRDWTAAEREFKRAIELKPGYAHAHDWYGWSVLAQAGRFTEAVARLEEGLALDPLSLAINTDYGNCLYWSGQYDAAIAQLERTLELDPAFFIARMFLGLSRAKAGDSAGAISDLETAVQSQHPYASGFLGFLYATNGKQERAREILAALDAAARTQYVPADAAALIHIGLGDFDRAFEQLTRACEERTVLSLSLAVEPCFDALRDFPRWPDLLCLSRGGAGD